MFDTVSVYLSPICRWQDTCRYKNWIKSHEVKGLHGSVDFVHNILRPALRPDAQVPLGPLDRVPSVGFLTSRFQALGLGSLHQGYKNQIQRLRSG